MIKAVCIALEDVYFLKGRTNFIKNVTEQGAPYEEAERIFVKSDVMNKIYKLGKISDDKYWEWAIKAMGLHLTPAEAVDLLISGYELNKPIEQLIKRLRENGIKTLICSNSYQARIEGLQQKFHFLENFDEAVFSFIRGVDKPNKEIFEALLKRSGLPADEIVYGDDYEPNIEGAKTVGINTILYTTYEDFAQQLTKLGVQVN
ncbi:MAG TPA: HAD-IA family hydrolase [Candidatus Saccharimonadales bacterium]|nr:HAD-IA family hydrolase [Candidatus Saccharimonadales bacterium]